MQQIRRVLQPLTVLLCRASAVVRALRGRGDAAQHFSPAESASTSERGHVGRLSPHPSSCGRAAARVARISGEDPLLTRPPRLKTLFVSAHNQSTPADICAYDAQLDPRGVSQRHQRCLSRAEAGALIPYQRMCVSL